MFLLAACSSSVLSLEVGTCFDASAPGGEFAANDVTVVDCEEPHDNEVFDNVALSGEAFPGVGVVAERADGICLDSFDAYVGEPYETSIYGLSWFVPSQETWNMGDREVICFAFDGGFAQITGSIEGSGR